jgi:beta-galactosidase
MNRKIILSILLMIFQCIALTAGERNINSDWSFYRLSQTISNTIIKNQGTDWNSQYNVEHIKGINMRLQIAEDTLKAEFYALKKASWEKVNLPHTPFIENLVVVHQWQGICYYKKILHVNREEAKQQLWLEFGGAMSLADVWINGQHVTQHAGGYTPFVVNATGLLKAGKDNEVLVRLDNRDNPLIPPGKPLERLDFCYYGGLYRNVNLIIKPSIHITNSILAEKPAGGGIFVTYPKVSETKADIQIQTDVSNTESISKNVMVKQSLYEWKKNRGKTNLVLSNQAMLHLAANCSNRNMQTLTLNHPKLWFPDSPNLYVLHSEIISDGKVLDEEDTRIGIRRLEMSREKGFVINGKPIRLVGTNRMMEYPYVGNALSDNAQYRDAYQIRNSGFNMVRLGFYIHDTSILDACDELGLLSCEAIPGWQFYNDDSTFVNLTYNNVRDMIRRDRNHPSIIWWETILNESVPPTSWKLGAIKAAKEEYPGDQCFTAGDQCFAKWKEQDDSYDISYNDFGSGYTRANNTKKPGFIREYYDYEFGGHYSTTRIGRGDGQAALLQNVWNAQWSHNRYRKQYPWTMGDAIFSMYDYNRGCCDNICHSGVADIFRLPKFSLHFFRSQIPEGSYTPDGRMPYELFVANYWQAVSTPDTVVVFGNVDEVALSINGKIVKRQKADDGPDTNYKKKCDGGNCRQLTFPPFTFTGVKWETGTLKAIGYHHGKKVTEQTVRTPGTPCQMDISYFESGRPASCNDLLIVNVKIWDATGTLCPVNGIPVSLFVKSGEVVGPSFYKSEAGISSFLVRTSDVRNITLEAVSNVMHAAKTIHLTFK